MTFIGNFKDLSIYLTKQDGIVLVVDRITYKTASKNIIIQLKFLQRGKDYKYSVLYKGDNLWLLGYGPPQHPISPYPSLEFCDFILNNEVIKDLILVDDILE